LQAYPSSLCSTIIMGKKWSYSDSCIWENWKVKLSMAHWKKACNKVKYWWNSIIWCFWTNSK